MATISRQRLKELVKEVMVEETEYQQFFSKALEKAGKSIPSMSDEEKKAFFDKIDAAWNGRGEKNEALVGGQKELDVDKDGDIEGDDLADLRAGKKANENITEAQSNDIVEFLKQNYKKFRDDIDDYFDVDENFKPKDIVKLNDKSNIVILKGKHENSFYFSFNENDIKRKYRSDDTKLKLKINGRTVHGLVKDNGLTLRFDEGKLTEGRYDKDLDKIEAAVKNASSFMGVGAELKKAGIKYDFTTSMIPMYMIKVAGNTIAICNKKYAAGAEREVKDMAIGLLEGVVKEGNDDIKVGDYVKIVDNPHWEAALVRKGIHPVKGPFKRKVKGIYGDNVFFTDGSNSSMKYVKK